MNNRIHLRLATHNDARQLWEWRNEAETREASFHTAEISYKDHLRWFREKIVDPTVWFLIAVDSNGRDVGYVRLDRAGDTAKINFSIDKHHRGKGFGSVLIRAATEFVIQKFNVRRVVAHIKAGNENSVRAFQRAGFVVLDSRQGAGADSIEMGHDMNP